MSTQYILTGLAKSFGCDFYFHKINDLNRRGKVLTNYKVVGQASKVETITYMYQFLLSEIDRLAIVAFSDVVGESARSWKNAFRLGASTTIYKRLMAQRKTVHQEAKDAGLGNALAVVRSAEKDVMRFMQNLRGMSTSSRGTCSSAGGFSAGRSAGGNVNLGGGGSALGRGSLRLTK